MQLIDKPRSSLRSPRLVREVEESFRSSCEREEFRIAHYSLQRDHVHLIIEASGAGALAAGMKSVGARVARAVNRVFWRRGPVLADRYHLRVLRSPRQVRNALAYVLLNARKHMARTRDQRRGASGRQLAGASGR
jgi:REP element-mobilizing transposase RayT